jgi:hypothetical protein
LARDRGNTLGVQRDDIEKTIPPQNLLWPAHDLLTVRRVGKPERPIWTGKLTAPTRDAELCGAGVFGMQLLTEAGDITTAVALSSRMSAKAAKPHRVSTR